MAKFTLMASADLSNKIKSVGKAGLSYDRLVQVCIVNAVGYSIEHGDIRPANQLLESLAKSTRKQAAVTFMERYGNLVYQSKDKKFAHWAGAADSTPKTFNGDALMLVEWTKSIKPETIVSEVDVSEAVDAFIKRMEKAIQRNPKNVKHGDLLMELQNVVARYHFGADQAETETETETTLEESLLLAA